MWNRVKTLNIQTPEGIVFPMQIAGPLTRFLAWVVDIVVILIISQLITVMLVMVSFLSMDIYAALVSLLNFIFAIGYPMVSEWFWRGQTVGKRLMRIRVIDEQGLKLKFSQIVIRNILRFVDTLPLVYMVGGTVSLISPKGQRLGDIAGNTIVIQHPKVTEPDLDQVLPDKYNSFRRYPHLAARLRQNVSPREAGIALEALMRRETLEAEPRLELFSDLAEHFKQVVRFPQEATDGLSDERYVRNIVDLLFRDGRR